jgi:succinoglycan biosynthesis protein ExoW
VRVLAQPNAGPGAARNLALERMDPAHRAVAFLDSDDAWDPLHLQRAQAALDAGADFYFADHKREDDPEPRFALCGYRPDGEAIPAWPELFWCAPREVFRAIVRRSPVGTSTVVIRRGAVGARRFETAYRAAGEDSIFWLETLEEGVRVAASRRCEAAYGRGVSVFNHRSWGDARSLRTTLDEMRAQHFLRARFQLEADLAAASRAQCARLDLSLCANLIACARRGRRDALGPVLDYLRLRPQALARLPAALVQALAAQRTSGLSFVGDGAGAPANHPGVAQGHAQGQK